MNRDITLGLLAIATSVFIIALIGLTENERMPRAETGYTMRKVESGALLFDQYCSNCHGQNAGGGVCPPLNQTSGLYGGDLGPGVAWRLEQLGWDKGDPYNYILATMATGRPISTRPDQYPGNRVVGAGNVMAMPPLAQPAGPLRPDQVTDIATYLTHFRAAIPDDATEAVKVVGTPPPTAAAAEPTSAVLPTPSVDLTAGDAERGKALFVSMTCVACHALPGVSEATVGPSQVGLFPRIPTRLADASYHGTAKTPEEYVYESLRNPNAFVVPEFAANGKSPMVVFPASRLPDQGIADLIAYLKQAGG